MDFGEIASFAFSALIGGGIVVGLMGFIYYRHAHKWRILAGPYARAWHKPIKQRWLGNVILYGGGPAFASYSGVVFLGVHETGISLRHIPFLSPFHAPIFIPYDDIRSRNTVWFLNARSVELEFLRAQDVKMVLPRETVEWVSKSSGVELYIHDGSTTHGARPNFWYAATLLIGVFALVLITPIALFENPFGRSVSEETLRTQFHLPSSVEIEWSNSRERQAPCGVQNAYVATATFDPESFKAYLENLDNSALWAPAPLAQFGEDMARYQFAPGALSWRDTPYPETLAGGPLYWPTKAAAGSGGKYFCYALRKVARNDVVDLFAAPCREATVAGPDVVLQKVALKSLPAGAVVRGVLDVERREIHMATDITGWPEFCRIPALERAIGALSPREAAER